MRMFRFSVAARTQNGAHQQQYCTVNCNVIKRWRNRNKKIEVVYIWCANAVSANDMVWRFVCATCSHFMAAAQVNLRNWKPVISARRCDSCASLSGLFGCVTFHHVMKYWRRQWWQLATETTVCAKERYKSHVRATESSESSQLSLIASTGSSTTSSALP